MTMKVIVELKAKPGRRDDLLAALEQLSARIGPQKGYVAKQRHTNLGDPDGLVDIDVWESHALFREFWRRVDPRVMDRAAELLAEPYRMTLVEDIE